VQHWLQQASRPALSKACQKKRTETIGKNFKRGRALAEQQRRLSGLEECRFAGSVLAGPGRINQYCWAVRMDGK
jgi:hypothetical protein